LWNGRWKGVRYRLRDAPLELYDLGADLNESKDLSGERPEIAAAIEGFLKTARTESPDWKIREVKPETRPNIVLILGEDMGPELGCYGDPLARTPNLDRFAGEGARFTRAFTHSPVCAPSRSGLITGRYPTSIGTHHMRSTLLKPPPLFTDFLKKAGYTVCWPVEAKDGIGKTDFNFDISRSAFDRRGDWTRDLPRRPFFAFYNIFPPHESRIRNSREEHLKLTARLKPADRQDPSKLKRPAYHPDTPETRQDLARYYELATLADYQLGDLLETLSKAGLAENTAVIFAGDHGRGLPRSKRWAYHQGIHVPLLVRWPGKIQPAAVRQDLVCFLDISKTILSIAGAEIPKELQGRIFLGPGAEAAPPYLFAARDRMDETFDRIRSVHDGRFHYLRNFHPELPYAQAILYMEEMPTMKAWRRLHAEGRLSAAQDLFFAPSKPAEELYDLEADPDEVSNLAGDPRQQAKLAEMRSALDRWIEQTGDLGAVPERQLIQRGLVKDRLGEYEERKAKGTKSSP
jgi:uncharacterized sulfatase